jgi:hypothetical protein
VKPGALLQRDGIADALILDGAEFGIVVRTEMLIGGLLAQQALARFLQGRGTEKAADMIGPEWRTT